MPAHLQDWCSFPNPEMTKAPGLPGPCLVREGGVEPPHPFEYTDLNRARLPIPPLALCPVAKAREGYHLGNCLRQ